jgi:hypothetical protein
VVLGDAAEVVAHEHWRGQVDALQVDLYDHEAAAPVLDSEAFYRDCRRLLTEDGCMTVNLFGRSSSYERSLARIQAAFGARRSGPSARRAKATPSCWRCASRSSRPAANWARADGDRKRWGLPARKWLRVFKPGRNDVTCHERDRAPKPLRPIRPPGARCDWQQLVQWLSEDGVISAEEARRTIARCSQAESAQHPLVRLAAVAMTRAQDGKPLDIETLTQYLAQRAGWTTCASTR